MAKDRITRRGLLGWIGGVAGASTVDRSVAAAPAAATSAPSAVPVAGSPQRIDTASLRRCADLLLPGVLPPAARDDAVAAFVRWVDGYAGDAEMDHGYGFTRLRRTAPHPAAGYADDLEALAREAQARHGTPLEGLPDTLLEPLIRDAIDAAAPAMGDLPGRPDDSHVLIAFMSHWFRSPAATDLAYGMRIGRESCRGLFTNVDGLEPLAGD